jgi:hypothetical protein
MVDSNVHFWTITAENGFLFTSISGMVADEMADFPTTYVTHIIVQKDLQQSTKDHRDCTGDSTTIL